MTKAPTKQSTSEDDPMNVTIEQARSLTADVSNMQTLMSSDNALQIDLQNDFPLFQTSQQTDPNERIMVINV